MSKGNHPLNTKKDNCTLLTAKLVGAAAADMTVSETGGAIVSAARSAAGVFAIVFRDSFPELKAIIGLQFGPRGTDGLKASFSAIDVVAKTATLQVEVGSTDTDPATTDTLYISLLVRNSGANRAG